MPLLHQLRSAIRNASIAQASYDVWWVHIEPKHRAARREDMAPYSSFFRFNYQAHFANLFMSTASLFDPSRNTISVPSVVRKAKAEGYDVSEHILADVDRLNSDFRVQGILYVRNKLYAHLDDKLVPDEVFEDARIKIRDVGAVISESAMILAEMAELVGLERPETSTSVRDDLLALLDKLAGRSAT